MQTKGKSRRKSSDEAIAHEADVVAAGFSLSATASSSAPNVLLLPTTTATTPSFGSNNNNNNIKIDNNNDDNPSLSSTAQPLKPAVLAPTAGFANVPTNIPPPPSSLSALREGSDHIVSPEEDNALKGVASLPTIHSEDEDDGNDAHLDVDNDENDYKDDVDDEEENNHHNDGDNSLLAADQHMQNHNIEELSLGEFEPLLDISITQSGSEDNGNDDNAVDAQVDPSQDAKRSKRANLKRAKTEEPTDDTVDKDAPVLFKKENDEGKEEEEEGEEADDDDDDDEDHDEDAHVEEDADDDDFVLKTTKKKRKRQVISKEGLFVREDDMMRELATLLERSLQSTGSRKHDWDLILSDASPALRAVIDDKDKIPSFRRNPLHYLVIANRRSRFREIRKSVAKGFPKREAKARSKSKSKRSSKPKPAPSLLPPPPPPPAPKATLKRKRSDGPKRAESQARKDGMNVDKTGELANLYTKLRQSGNGVIDWDLLASKASDELKPVLKKARENEEFHKNPIKILVPNCLRKRFDGFMSALANQKRLKQDGNGSRNVALGNTLPHTKRSTLLPSSPPLLSSTPRRNEKNERRDASSIDASEEANSTIIDYENATLQQLLPQLAWLVVKGRHLNDWAMDWKFVEDRATPRLSKFIEDGKTAHPDTFGHDPLSAIVPEGDIDELRDLMDRMERGIKKRRIAMPARPWMYLTEGATPKPSQRTENSQFSDNWRNGNNRTVNIRAETNPTYWSSSSSSSWTADGRNGLNSSAARRDKERRRSRRALLGRSLTSDEEELAWLLQESRFVVKGAVNQVNWDFVVQHAPKSLRDRYKQESIAHPASWSDQHADKVEFLVRQQVRDDFEELSKEIHSRLIGGYRRGKMVEHLDLRSSGRLHTTEDGISKSQTRVRKVIPKQIHSVGDSVMACQTQAVHDEEWRRAEIKGIEVAVENGFEVRYYTLYFHPLTVAPATLGDFGGKTSKRAALTKGIGLSEKISANTSVNTGIGNRNGPHHHHNNNSIVVGIGGDKNETIEGKLKEGVHEAFVKTIEDHAWLATNSEEVLKGIVRCSDPRARDKYNRLRGWYETCITGRTPFVSVCDAMRAYDEAYVKNNGANTKQVDLNLPNNWNFHTPDAIPVFIGTTVTKSKPQGEVTIPPVRTRTEPHSTIRTVFDKSELRKSSPLKSTTKPKRRKVILPQSDPDDDRPWKQFKAPTVDRVLQLRAGTEPHRTVYHTYVRHLELFEARSNERWHDLYSRVEEDWNDFEALSDQEQISRWESFLATQQEGRWQSFLQEESALLQSNTSIINTVIADDGVSQECRAKYQTLVERYLPRRQERFDDSTKRLRQDAIDFSTLSRQEQLQEWSSFLESQYERWQYFKYSEDAVLKLHVQQCDELLSGTNQTNPP